MNTRSLVSFIAIICFITGLAGCDQPPPETKQKPVAKITKESQAQPSSIPKADAPTTKALLSYYSAHLTEAKKVWHECLNKGLKNISDEEKPRCVAAQNAWHNQPYKAGGK